MVRSTKRSDKRAVVSAPGSRHDQEVPLKRTNAVVALFVLSVLALASCAAEPVGATPSSVAESVEPSAPPSTPSPELKAGDILSQDAAEKINASWGRATDDKAYLIPSGEYVLIKGNEPLPEVVSSTVVQTVTPLGVEQGRSSKANPDAQIAFNDSVEEQENATGRKIAIVIYAMNAISHDSEEPRWSMGSGIGGGYNGTSREEAIAIAQGWVDKSPFTRMMVVIDALA